MCHNISQHIPLILPHVLIRPFESVELRKNVIFESRFYNLFTLWSRYCGYHGYQHLPCSDITNQTAKHYTVFFI